MYTWKQEDLRVVKIEVLLVIVYLADQMNTTRQIERLDKST